MITEQIGLEMAAKTEQKACNACGTPMKTFFGNEDYNPSEYCPRCES
jgi:hypothetical protein